MDIENVSNIKNVAIKINDTYQFEQTFKWFLLRGFNSSPGFNFNQSNYDGLYLGVKDDMISFMNASEIANEGCNVVGDYDEVFLRDVPTDKTIPEVIEMMKKKEGEYHRYCVSLVYAKQQNGNATLELRSAITESRSEFEALGEVVTNFTNKMPGFGLILHNAIEIKNDKSGDNERNT